MTASERQRRRKARRKDPTRAILIGAAPCSARIALMIPRPAPPWSAAIAQQVPRSRS